MMRPVRVLIVDDSLTMRRLIRLALSADPRIEVVGEARDAVQARRQLDELRPDVMTLDVEMPGKSGLDFLEEVMATKPLPVIMVSTETQKGSISAVEALSLGAVDCVGKPQGASRPQAFAMLNDMIIIASQAKVQVRRNLPLARPVSRPRNFQWNGRFVVIGSSTGGVDALERILAEFPANCPPTVITQHMPQGFLASFAHRLDTRILPTVTLATTGAPLLPGVVYLAPGGAEHLTLTGAASPVCQLIEGEKRSGHRPSVDMLFDSAVMLGVRGVSVLLTGMGRDGAEGMLRMRQAGATCLAQDKDSSVVWGMPRVAHEIGAAERLVPLSQMCEAILTSTGRGYGR